MYRWRDKKKLLKKESSNSYAKILLRTNFLVQIDYDNVYLVLFDLYTAQNVLLLTAVHSRVLKRIQTTWRKSSNYGNIQTNGTWNLCVVLPAWIRIKMTIQSP